MAQRWGLRSKIGVCLFLLSPASAGCAAVLVMDRDHHAAVDASRSGGVLEVAITVDDAGHITGFTPLSDDAPQHLVALVKRTLKLLGAGTSAIRSGSVSAGTEVLRISASLRDMDESEMKATPLSFGYDRGKGKGKAGFTQPGGRHVNVSVEVVRVVEGGTKP
jgi:hypothetical protein